MSNARKTLDLVRKVRAAIVGCELDCRIHSVRRVGDAGHAVISVDAVNEKGRRTWTSGRMAVLLDTLANGITPMFRGRTEPAARCVRALGMTLDRNAMTSLNYWVDSSAHYWCVDNAPHLYTRSEA